MHVGEGASQISTAGQTLDGRPIDQAGVEWARASVRWRRASSIQRQWAAHDRRPRRGVRFARGRAEFVAAAACGICRLVDKGQYHFRAPRRGFGRKSGIRTRKSSSELRVWV